MRHGVRTVRQFVGGARVLCAYVYVLATATLPDCEVQTATTVETWTKLEQEVASGTQCIDVTGATLHASSTVVIPLHASIKIFATRGTAVLDGGNTFNAVGGSNDDGTRLFYSLGDLSLENLTLTRAQGQQGGAVQVKGGSVTAVNVIFSQNRANSNAGAVSIEHTGSTVTALFEDCLFTGNSANGQGGAAIVLVPSVYAQGGVVFRRCTFENSYAGYVGGAVSIIYNHEDTTFPPTVFWECTFPLGSNRALSHTPDVATWMRGNVNMYGTTISGQSTFMRAVHCGSSCADVNDTSQGCTEFTTGAPDARFRTCYSCLPCSHCSKGKYRERFESSFDIDRDCSVCPAGQYQPSSSATACLPCPSGKYEEDDGTAWQNHVSCRDCPDGFDAPTGSRCCEGHGMPHDNSGTACVECPQGTFANTSRCSVCAKGRYANASGLTACLQCPSGKVIADDGQVAAEHVLESSCSDCPSGYVSDSSGSACSVCAPGAERHPNGECHTCAAGQYSEADSQCTPCPPGKYIPETASSVEEHAHEAACLSCPRGTAAPLQNTTLCAVCMPGQYAEQVGSTACTGCPAGTYLPDDDGDRFAHVTPLLCRPCQIGRSSNLLGSASCAVCQAGRYSPGLGLTTCYNCLEGYVSDGIDDISGNATGDVACAACPAGKFGHNSTSCTFCPAGKFQSSSGRSECVECNAGLVPDEDRIRCDLCEAGHFSFSGDASCTPCEIGRYAGVGSSTCTICEAGTHAGAGRSSCLRCGAGTFALSGSSTCEVCPHGSVPTDDNSGCRICDAGSSATNGSSTCATCHPGTYAGRGSGTCSPCPQGKYAGAASGACEDCVGGSVPSIDSGSCVRCGTGSVAVSGSSTCATCDNGEIPEDDRASCIACPTGQFSSAGDSTCKRCPEDEYLQWRHNIFSSDGATSLCVTCSAFKMPSTDQTYCVIHGWATLLLAAGTLGFGGAVGILFFNLQRPRRILDLTGATADRVRIKCIGRHCIRPQMGRAVRVLFVGTGIRTLDDPLSSHWIARVPGPDELELHVADNATLAKELSRMEASQGHFKLAMSSDLLDTAVLGDYVPTLAAIATLLVSSMANALAFPLYLQQTRLLSWVLVAYCSAVLLFGFVALGMRWNTRSSPQDRRIRRYRSEVVGGKSIRKPRRCDPGPNRAIQVQDLVHLLDAFIDVIHERTAYYLDSNIIKPITKPYQLSFAEVVGAREVAHFVSHYWGTPFRHFVAAIQRHAALTYSLDDCKTATYWICFLSNNQWDVSSELGSNWDESSFYLTLRSGCCKSVCMVLDAHALPLTRTWCIFELFVTFQLKNEGCFGNFVGLELCTEQGVLGREKALYYDVALALGERLANLSVADATASSKKDDDMIKGMIVNYLDTLSELDDLVRQNMAQVMANVKAYFSEETNTLDLNLRSHGKQHFKVEL